VRRTISCLLVLVCLLLSVSVDAMKFKVLVVMSYEQDNPWCVEIREGIEAALGDSSDITYFYMNTKADFKGGPDRAKEAFELYQRLQPDGVITADDDAQSMFVLPYLKGSTSAPVMFCGVNAEPAEYGYPTRTITGMLERGHVRESIAFTQQLQPAVKRIGFLANDIPAGQAMRRQIEAEKGEYAGAAVIGISLVKTTTELTAACEAMSRNTDALYIDSLEGIADAQQKPLKNKEVLDIIRKTYRKPIIGANRYHVEQGALCAVVKTGQEQGETAAAMLLKAMRGTPVEQLAVTRNYIGRRIINVNALEAFGITPKPVVLRGATLVRTQ